MGKFLSFFLFFITLATAGLNPVWAQESSLEDELPKDLGAHVKEVFLKGSSDGKSMFTVLGLSKSAKLSKKILKKMVRLQELIDIGDRFNNPDHSNDFKDEWQTGIERTKEAAPEILKAPWRSVKKIPYSHMVTVQQARDSYESSGSVAGGIVKYTGLVAWAYVKDAYYLVIETPFELVKNLAITTLAVPFRLTMQIAEIGLRFTWMAVKTTAALLASGMVLAYSVISTTVGALVDFLIEAPTFIWRPLQMGEDLNVKPEKLTELGLILEQVLANNVAPNKEIQIDSVKKDKSEKYKLYVLDEKKEKTLAYVAKISIRKQSVFFDFEMGRAYFESLKEELKDQGMDKADRKDKIKLDMRHLVDILKSKIPKELLRLEELDGGNIFQRLQIEQDVAAPAEKLVKVGEILARVIEKELGGDLAVLVEPELLDNKENFKVYVGKTDTAYAYDVTLSVKKKNLYLDFEMVRSYYRLLKKKFKDAGVVKGSIEEHIGLDMRKVVNAFNLELSKAMANEE
jgi:hypothetical protein